MRGWDWEDTWITFVLLLLTTAVGLGFFVAVQDHHVRRYYVDSPDGSNGLYSCVYADAAWEPDAKVFCSPVPKEVLGFAEIANEELAGAKPLTSLQ